MKAPHKLDPRPEEAWFDRTIDELAELRRRLEADAGLSAATANGLVGAIIAHDFDTIDCSTAARYRKVLRELGTPTTPEHPARRRRTRAVGQRGAAQIRSTAAGTLVGASVALAAVSPPAAILCGVAAPIILVM